MFVSCVWRSFANEVCDSGMAVLFFFTTGIFFFIPYVADHFKDVKHSCIRCGRGLATHHFGAGTEAHLM